MDLRDFSTEFALRPSLDSLPALAPRLWDQAYAIIGNETRTEPTVAAVLSQIVFLTDACEAAFRRRNLDPADDSTRDLILLTLPTSGYTLLVVDENCDASVQTETLRLDYTDLGRATARWQHELASSPFDRPGSNWQILNVYRGLSSGDLYGLDRFDITFIKRPRIVRTHCPIPAWNVLGINGRASAGCMVRDESGTPGVTTVRHFLSDSDPTGLPVTVEGLPGIVARQDLISDSVFITMLATPPAPSCHGVQGWLNGVTPRIGSPARFVGATSGQVTTAVSGQDPNVVRYSPIRQARIYTPPVTNPGDSGAALIEEPSDLIMGFAMERTEAGALIEYSSWIWADSVFQALHVTPQ